MRQGSEEQKLKTQKKKCRADEEEVEKFQKLNEETKEGEMGIQMKIFNENKEEKKLSVVFPVNVKLPKLVISKFEGIDFGWFHFWNQFESEVD